MTKKFICIYYNGDESGYHEIEADDIRDAGGQAVHAGLDEGDNQIEAIFEKHGSFIIGDPNEVIVIGEDGKREY